MIWFLGLFIVSVITALVVASIKDDDNIAFYIILISFCVCCIGLMFSTLFIGLKPSKYMAVKYIDNKLTIVEESEYQLRVQKRKSYVDFITNVTEYELFHNAQPISPSTTDKNKILSYFIPEPEFTLEE